MAYHLKPAAESSLANSEHPLRSPKPHVALRQVSITGQRYYRPGTGRWKSRDPLSERGGIGLYAFVFNAPFEYVDDTGLTPVKIGDVLPGILPFPTTTDWRILLANWLAYELGGGLGDGMAYYNMPVWTYECEASCELSKSGGYLKGFLPRNRVWEITCIYECDVECTLFVAWPPEANKPVTEHPLPTERAQVSVKLTADYDSSQSRCNEPKCEEIYNWKPEQPPRDGWFSPRQEGAL